MSEAPAAEVTFREAEEAVLGAILLRGTLIDLVQSILKPDDFESVPHSYLYETMQIMAADGDPIEFASVLSALRKNNRLAIVGGEAALTRLGSLGVTLDVKHYAEIVKDQAGIRRIRNVAVGVVERTQPGGGVTSSELLNSFQSELSDLAEGNSTEGDLTPTSGLIGPALDTIQAASEQGQSGAIVGVPSGLTDLDQATTGFLPGQMIVIAARPGFGKSTLGLDIARNASIWHDKTVALFSLEMSSSEIMIRLMAADMRIDMGALRAGTITESDWDLITGRYAKITSAPLFIDDTANTNMADIKTKAKRLKAKAGLDLIVIDYLQLLGSSQKAASREQEVSQISRQTKLMAKELGVPVVVMAQLNRGSEHRQGGKPVLSDLRESGAIEQDADVVIFIHREDLVDETSGRIGEADLVLAKQRNGPTKTIPVGFQGHYSRFANLSRQHEPPEPEGF